MATDPSRMDLSEVVSIAALSASCCDVVCACRSEPWSETAGSRDAGAASMMTVIDSTMCSRIEVRNENGGIYLCL